MSYLPYNTARYILENFEKMYLAKYAFHKYSKHIKGESPESIVVYLVEDSLVLLIDIIGESASVCCNAEEMYGYYRNNDFLEFPITGETYYKIRIEELTPNEIGLKYVHSKFVKKMEEITKIDFLPCVMSYNKFESDRMDYWRSVYWGMGKKDNELKAETRINELFPELNLARRLSLWHGTHYYFIVFEMEDVNARIHRAVAYTKCKPHTYILTICDKWAVTGKINCTSVIDGTVQREMQKAFDSWKRMARISRLEKHLKYFYLERYCMDLGEIYHCAREIAAELDEGKYQEIERIAYKKPENRWIAEEQVYRIICKLFDEYIVIRQHRPFFLRSEKGGQMSYDVFISKLNVAVEYQGIQHFEPVAYFGGQTSFEETCKRDALKKQLSIDNGVKLVYINYFDEITPELIQGRIIEAFNAPFKSNSLVV